MNQLIQDLEPAPMLAVCYRCFYRGPAAQNQRCPECDFALITEVDEPTRERHIEDIFSRYSVRAGAPKLPGIATHHGFHTPAPQMLAIGTLPPPDSDGPAQVGAVPVVLRAASSPKPPPIPLRPARATTAITGPSSRGGVSLAAGRRGLRLLEVVCVAACALAAGVGAAILTTVL